MKRAIIYARVSYAKRREEKVSIAAQIEQSKDLAARLEARVEEVFIDDGKSAWHGHRPAFEDALDYCDMVDIDYFITWSTSRFSRNRIHAAMDKDRLTSAGVEVKYVSSPIDRSTDEGWLLDGIYELFDEHTSRGISRDTKRSMIKNAREGYWNGGQPPFGYKPVPAAENPKKRRLDIAEDEAEVARRIFQLRARGLGGLSISRKLNEEGATNRGRSWNRISVINLLNNETVIGNVVFNKKDRRTGKARPPGEWIRVKAYPALIDEALWQKVQTLMAAARPTVKNRTNPRSKHLFTGMIYCGECGAPMRTHSSHGDGGLYYYYVCSETVATASHPANRVRADKLDHWLSDEICSKVFTPETIAGILNDLREIVGNWAKEQAERKESVIKKLQVAEAKQSKIFDLFETHGRETPNLGDLTRRLREHNSQIRRCEDELERIDAERPPRVDVNDELVSDVVDFLRGQMTSGRKAQQVREFFGSFLERVEVHGGRVALRYRPERLVIPQKDEGSVRSMSVWLPGRDVLRTRFLELRIPETVRRLAA